MKVHIALLGLLFSVAYAPQLRADWEVRSVHFCVEENRYGACTESRGFYDFTYTVGDCHGTSIARCPVVIINGLTSIENVHGIEVTYQNDYLWPNWHYYYWDQDSNRWDVNTDAKWWDHGYWYWGSEYRDMDDTPFDYASGDPVWAWVGWAPGWVIGLFQIQLDE